MTDPCDEYALRIDPFVDGESTDSETETVRRHVASCSLCAAAVAAHQHFGSGLRDAVTRAATRDLAGITWPPRPSRIDTREPDLLTRVGRLIYDVSRWLNPWPVYAGSAVLIAVIVGLGGWRSPPVVETVEIERLDAAGPVMVMTGEHGRSAIIWVTEPPESRSSESVSTPI